MPRQPFDYHEPEHAPEDPGWGWLIVLVVAAIATAAGVLLGPVSAVVVGALAVLGLAARHVRRIRVAKARRGSA